MPASHLALPALLRLGALLALGAMLISASFGGGWLLGHLLPWSPQALSVTAASAPAAKDAGNPPASSPILPTPRAAEPAVNPPASHPRRQTRPPSSPHSAPRRTATKRSAPSTATTSRRGNWLYIPKLEVAAPVKAAPTLSDQDIIRTAAGGVALYPNGVKPGEAGRVFLAGHSTYWKGKYKFVFRGLDQLKRGDEVQLDWKGKRYTYKVSAKVIINPRKQKLIPADTDLATLALMTCTPLWTSRKRLVVYATLARIDKLAFRPLQ